LMRPLIVPIIHKLAETIKHPGFKHVGLVIGLHLAYDGWPALARYNMPYPKLPAAPGEPAQSLTYCLLPGGIELRSPISQNLPGLAIFIDAFLQEPQGILSGRVVELLRPRDEA